MSQFSRSAWRRVTISFSISAPKGHVEPSDQIDNENAHPSPKPHVHVRVGENRPLLHARTHIFSGI